MEIYIVKLYEVATYKHTDFIGLNIEESFSNIPPDNQISFPSTNFILLRSAHSSISRFIEGIFVGIAFLYSSGVITW